MKYLIKLIVKVMKSAMIKHRIIVIKLLQYGER